MHILELVWIYSFARWLIVAKTKTQRQPKVKIKIFKINKKFILATQKQRNLRTYARKN